MQPHYFFFIFTPPFLKDFGLFFNWVVQVIVYIKKVEKVLKWFILVSFFYITETWHFNRGV